jgi:hypothetical protein
MLSESTARLVEHMVVLAEPERVHIKGADDPVPACRLLAIQPRATSSWDLRWRWRWYGAALLDSGWAVTGGVRTSRAPWRWPEVATRQPTPWSPSGNTVGFWLLRPRALVAMARGDEVAYRDLAARYREMAKSLGFEGHIAVAEAMM